MIHLRKGRKLKRTSSHKKSLLRNLATALLEHKRIVTTEAKAKELRPYVEKLITRAKKALQREQQHLLPEGQKVDIHNRRLVYREIRRKAVLQELFDAIAPVVENRPGGYTRIIKYGFRRGDAGKTAIIELVDWSNPRDGEYSKKERRRTTKAKAKAPAPKKVKEKVEEAQEIKEQQEQKVEEVKDTIEKVDVVEKVESTEIVEQVEEKIQSEDLVTDVKEDKVEEKIEKEEISDNKVEQESNLEKEKIEEKSSSENEIQAQAAENTNEVKEESNEGKTETEQK